MHRLRAFALLLILPGCSLRACGGHAAGPVVIVSVPAPGYSPAETDARVAQPMMAALAGLAAVDTVLARSEAGEVSLGVAFAAGTPPLRAIDGVRERLARLSLPDDVEAPLLRSAVTAAAELRFDLTGELPGILATVYRTDLHPTLARLPGVTAVSACGVVGRRIEVRIADHRLMQFGLTGDEVAARTRAAMLAGTSTGTSIGAAPAAQPVDPSDLRDIVIGQRNGAPIRLGDVADIRDTATDPECTCPAAASVCISVSLADPRAKGSVRAAVRARAEALPPAISLRESAPEPARWVAFLCGDDAGALRGPTERIFALGSSAGHDPQVTGIGTDSEIQLRPDRERLAAFGVSAAAVARALRAATAGIEVRGAGMPGAPPVVLFTGGPADDLEALARVPIPTTGPGGALVPLSAVAQLVMAAAPVGILRRNGQRCMAVTFAAGPSVADGLQSLTEQVELQPGQTLQGSRVGPLEASILTEGGR